MVDEVEPEEVPDGVVSLTEALGVRSRLTIVSNLMERPMTFAELSERVPVSATALRGGLIDLANLGYVTDDSPDGRQRKTRTALFQIDREKVLRDAAALMIHLAR